MTPTPGSSDSGAPDLAALFEPRLVATATAEMEEAISALVWRPDGSVVAAGSLGGELVLFDPEGGFVASLDTAAPVLGACWSPGGGVLAAACEDGSAWLWPPGGTPTRHAVGAPAEDLAWGAGVLAVATGDAVVLIEGDEAHRSHLVGPAGAAIVVAWTGSGPGARLLAGGLGGLRQVPLDGGEGETWPLAAVVALAVDPTSGIVAAGTLGGDIEIGRDGITLQAGRDAVERLAWSPAGSLLAAVADGRLTVWTLRVHDSAVAGPRRLEGHDDWVTDAAFSPASQQLASVGVDGRLVLWDPGETSDPLERLAIGGPLATLGWRPDGRALAVGGRDGVLTLVDCSAVAPPPG